MLTQKRTAIIEKCRVAMVGTMGLPESHEFDRGLTILYDQLVDVIHISVEEDSAEVRQKLVAEMIVSATSREHARDAHRRGYTIAQLVRGYGSLCQGITEYALEHLETITSAEFAQLNLSLDVAIASAVTEFQRIALGTVEKNQERKMGYLIHEIRNSLSSAVLSHELIRLGKVGHSGATSRIITNSLNQMRELIDRSVAEYRMGKDQEIELSVFKVVDLLSEVESSLTSESNAKYLIVYLDCNPDIEVEADRHLMVSAITNLMQNAIKYTKAGGRIWLRVIVKGTDLVIEVEDQCGGLAEGRVEELLNPKIQSDEYSSDPTIGLSIVRRAVELNGCTLELRNVPGTGCIFGVRMPAHVVTT